MARTERDVLLIARPDHSMQIYRALLGQDRLTFHYITFKVVHEFVKKIIPYKKLQTVSRHCTIGIKQTFVQVCKKTFFFKFAQKWETDDFLSDKVEHHLQHHKYKIIHYWPEYCSTTMNRFNEMDNDTIVLADMYMPNPAVIIEEMKPVYEKYGLSTDSDSWLANYARLTQVHFHNVRNICCASSYVKKTLEQTFPDKKYYIVPYGITVSPCYRKKIAPATIQKFVYIGRISVEKGVDFVLDWFVQHPEMEIHLYGRIQTAQEDIFARYSHHKHIVFHGTVSKKVLFDEMAKYDVGIHMSRFDAYSLSVGEMIGSGLPVIVSDHTGIMDEVTEHHLGLVSSIDEESLINAISRITTPIVYQKFIEDIDSYILSHPKTFGLKMMELYQELLSQKEA